MRSSLPEIFSYLSMTAGLIALFSAFGMIIIFLRSFVINISEQETKTGYILLYLFIVSLILVPIFFYLSNRYEPDNRSN